MQAKAFLVESYPSPSEQFITRDIAALRAGGLPVLVIAWRSDAGADAQLRLLPRRSLRRRSVDLLRGAPGFRRHPANLPAAGLLAGLAIQADAAAVAAICRREGVSHLHAGFASRTAAVGMVAAAMCGISFSLSAHARDIFVENAGLTQKVAAAAFAVACSHYGSQALRERIPQELHGRVHTIRHCLPDLPDLPDLPPDEPPLLLGIGRLVPKKGFEVLISACALLRDAGRDFRCIIAGEGPLRELLQELTAALQLENIIALPGWQAPEDIALLMKRAVALAVPSLIASDGDRDGLPNVVPEALLAGLPVAAARTAAIPELIRHGITGLLVPPGDPGALADALARLLDDRPAALAMTAAGRRQVLADFNPVANAAALKELFDRYSGGVPCPAER